jgi:hypothetical protein
MIDSYIILVLCLILNFDCRVCVDITVSTDCEYPFGSIPTNGPCSWILNVGGSTGICIPQSTVTCASYNNENQCANDMTTDVNGCYWILNGAGTSGTCTATSTLECQMYLNDSQCILDTTIEEDGCTWLADEVGTGGICHSKSNLECVDYINEEQCVDDSITSSGCWWNDSSYVSLLSSFSLPSLLAHSLSSLLSSSLPSCQPYTCSSISLPVSSSSCSSASSYAKDKPCVFIQGKTTNPSIPDQCISQNDVLCPIYNNANQCTNDIITSTSCTWNISSSSCSATKCSSISSANNNNMCTLASSYVVDKPCLFVLSSNSGSSGTCMSFGDINCNTYKNMTQCNNDEETETTGCIWIVNNNNINNNNGNCYKKGSISCESYLNSSQCNSDGITETGCRWNNNVCSALKCSTSGASSSSSCSSFSSAAEDKPCFWILGNSSNIADKCMSLNDISCNSFNSLSDCNNNNNFNDNCYWGRSNDNSEASIIYKCFSKTEISSCSNFIDSANCTNINNLEDHRGCWWILNNTGTGGKCYEKNSFKCEYYVSNSQCNSDSYTATRCIWISGNSSCISRNCTTASLATEEACINFPLNKEGSNNNNNGCIWVLNSGGTSGVCMQEGTIPCSTYNLPTQCYSDNSCDVFIVNSNTTQCKNFVGYSSQAPNCVSVGKRECINNINIINSDNCEWNDIIGCLFKYSISPTPTTSLDNRLSNIRLNHVNQLIQLSSSLYLHDATVDTIYYSSVSFSIKGESNSGSIIKTISTSLSNNDYKFGFIFGSHSSGVFDTICFIFNSSTSLPQITIRFIY